MLSTLAAGALVARSSGMFSDGELDPIDLTEQLGGPPRDGLSPDDLAASCEDNPRPDCDALITASCWDGPQGLTQYVCLATPTSPPWERLAWPFEAPARAISASDSGAYLIVGEHLLDRDGQEIPSRHIRGDRWFGYQDQRIRVDDEGTATIMELDGTVIESIDPPEDTAPWSWTKWELSHDQTKIAVLSGGTHTNQLWLYDRTGHHWTLIADDLDYLYLPLITGLGFTPDDQHIITVRIAREDDGSIQPRRFHVVRIAVDGGSVETLQTVVTEGGIHSSVSPDGTLIALSNGLGQTRLLNLDSLQVSDRASMCCAQDSLRWSPNGSFLVSTSGDILEVVETTVPLAHGPFILHPPDPQGVNLPLVRPQAS